MTETELRERRNEWSAPYWEGVDRQELRYQHCEECGRSVFPARLYCPRCASDRLVWRPSNGRGEIYSFSTLELGAVAAFIDDVPYTIVVVDLDEGFRMTSRVVTDDPISLRCGLRVQVDFPSNGRPLPVFIPLLQS